MSNALPKGQFEIDQMPRFGLPDYANRFPKRPTDKSILIRGEVAEEITIPDLFASLPLTEQVSDFHCVTTWSVKNLRWKGIRFKDLYTKVIGPTARPAAHVAYCQVHSQDGYRSCLPMKDMLADNVLIAGWLNDEPLSIAHGAPMRLVAPDHYGYKNAKHIKALSFHTADQRPATALRRFLNHPRGRVRLEERGGLPGIILRHLYRPLINGTRKKFQDALDRYEAEQ